MATTAAYNLSNNHRYLSNNHRYLIANINFNLTVIRSQQLNILSCKQVKYSRK